MSEFKKQSASLLEEISNPIIDIEKDIQELYEEKERLSSTLDSSDNQFKMDVVKKNKQIQADINLMENTIRKAEQRKEQLIKASAETTYKKANDIIKEHKRELREKENHYNVSMIKHIEKIRNEFKEMYEKDRAYNKEINEFIDSIKPYLDPENKPQLGNRDQHYSLLNQHVYRFGGRYGLTILEAFNEGMFGIQGLMTIKPKHLNLEKQEKEKYSTDTE